METQEDTAYKDIRALGFLIFSPPNNFGNLKVSLCMQEVTLIWEMKRLKENQNKYIHWKTKNLYARMETEEEEL